MEQPRASIGAGILKEPFFRDTLYDDIEVKYDDIEGEYDDTEVKYDDIEGDYDDTEVEYDEDHVI